MGKRRRNDDKEITEAPASGQVLPVAELGADFDGDAEDGATYLALASREAASLPFYTRADPPASYSVAANGAGEVTVEVERGRHPALPRESWEVVNAAHFRAYKARIAAHWPPDPRLECPYPSPPEVDDEEGWRAYIAGTAGEDEDEEAAMNAAPESREPLVSLLSGLDTDDTLALLAHFNTWLADDAPLSALWGRWIFALLCVLDSRLDADQQSQLRDLVRTLTSCILVRWEEALAANELQPIEWKEGFYGVQTVAPPPPIPVGATSAALGEAGNGTGREEGAHQEEKSTPAWTLGARWKNARDATPKSAEPSRPPDDNSVDSVLARAWILISAVVAGWGQWDLIDEVNAQVSQLPRHS